MHCLGCGYNLKQLTQPRCPECGRGFDAADESSWGSAKSYRQLIIVKLTGRLVVLLCVAVTSLCFYRIAMGEDPLLAIYFPWFFAFLPLMIFFGVWLGLSLKLPAHPKVRVVLVLLSCFILNASFFTSWPLDLGFKLSENDLTQLAKQVEAGQPPAVPVRAGLYTVAKIDLRDGHATLWVSGGNGPDGFVHGMAGPQIARNYWLWSSHRINGDWHIVHED